jgi:hypothetical protein
MSEFKRQNIFSFYLLFSKTSPYFLGIYPKYRGGENDTCATKNAKYFLGLLDLYFFHIAVAIMEVFFIAPWNVIALNHLSFYFGIKSLLLFSNS